MVSRDGRSRFRSRRGLTTFGAITALLFGAAYLDFGTGLTGETSLLRLLVGVAAAGTLLTAPWLNWRQRAASLAVVVGLAAFLFGVYGGAVSCHEAEYGVPTDDHGVEYDWWTNTLHFGENVDGSNYRCLGTPSRTATLAGYALTSAGALELLT
ncbi:hypothetical protein [Halorussus ruber]|uniref:hypothetical protein n=1 Tax=Halorussus ruber TaxID=1126238 RepID=UPI001091BF76|nr:hypothetical protein [Halorussus ruber]